MFLELGVPVDALYDGDPYFDIAKDSTALHVAAWKARPKTVQLLIERGAIVRITALDTPVPFSPPLEHYFLPKVEDVVREARKLHAY